MTFPIFPPFLNIRLPSPVPVKWIKFLRIVSHFLQTPALHSRTPARI
jgi:hypothetical protein